MPAIPNIESLSAATESTSLSLRSLIDHVTSSIKSVPSHLAKRQQYCPQGIIPCYYKYGGPAPGAVVGIILGSVAGFLLLIWLFYSLTISGGIIIQGEEEVVVRRRDRSPRRRRARVTEVRDVSRSPRRERIIVEERRAERMPSPPRRSSIIVEERTERRVDGDDIVEVIEDHSDITPPRRMSRRSGSHYRY